MDQIQLIHSSRLDKLQELVRIINSRGEEKFYEDEDLYRDRLTLQTMMYLMEVRDLCQALVGELATQHKVISEL